MSVWIKICGLRSPEAVAAALEAGVQALGFVFAPGSPRTVTPREARALCRDVPPEVARIAVMQHPEPAHWQAVWQEFRPDALQTDAQDFGRLELDAACRALPVYRDASCPDPERTQWPARLLFEGAASGRGSVPDWALASRVARRAELVLAGGLAPENVAEAVRRVRPFGVDVSSGVESARGVKDPARIRAFVAAVQTVGVTT